MRQKIAIVAGGDSGEYEISIKSAAVVRDNLDRDRFLPFLIVMRGGEWMCYDEQDRKVPVDKSDFSIMAGGDRMKFDAVFIAIHGTPGEDGRLQAYFDLLGLPYTSCDHTTSALTFNKYFSSLVVAGMGAKVAPSVLLFKNEDHDLEQIITLTGFPCFVKPNAGGSSVGMSKVRTKQDLQPAIDKAFMEDEQVLVEAFIDGREITCGVISDHGEVRSLPVTEIITKNDFFDFEAKYDDSLTDEITPADIPQDIERSSRALSERLYRSLNCKGFVRFDYIYNDEGIFFLEVNTVPGLSPNSILPQQAKAVGISLRELFTMSLDQCMG